MYSKKSQSNPYARNDDIQTFKLAETIVRIEYKGKVSTGFLMKINLKENQQNFLVTCDHCIS